MKHLGTKTIETLRLVLRRFEPGDAEAMYRNWANDSEVTKFLTWPPHRNIDDTRAVLKDWVKGYDSNEVYQWAIVLKEIEEPIGSIGSVSQRDEIGMIHIGYCIGKSWWNMGITSEALAALQKFFFEEVGVSRIESRHDPHNPNSGKVMLKCGMKYEGTMRKADRNNQGICDFSEYAILAENFFWGENHG